METLTYYDSYLSQQLFLLDNTLDNNVSATVGVSQLTRAAPSAGVKYQLLLWGEGLAAGWEEAGDTFD